MITHDVVDATVYNITHNVEQPSPHGPTGFGKAAAAVWRYPVKAMTKLGEWDGGATRVSHQEFTDNGPSRVIQSDNATSLSSHATHVAGTLIAGGVSIEAKGMSYKGFLKAYDWNNAESEMAAAASQGLEISNHSYGWLTGWHSSNGNWTWYGDNGISADEDW